jgi:hypothetical protein
MICPLRCFCVVLFLIPMTCSREEVIGMASFCPSASPLHIRVRFITLKHMKIFKIICTTVSIMKCCPMSHRLDVKYRNTFKSYKNQAQMITVVRKRTERKTRPLPSISHVKDTYKNNTFVSSL